MVGQQWNKGMRTLALASLSLAALLVMVVPAEAAPNISYPGANYEAGLTGINFVGFDCTPAAWSPQQTPAGVHGVINAHASAATRYVDFNSVTNYRLGDFSTSPGGAVMPASDPRDVEGYTNGQDPHVNITTDAGYFIGRMQTAIPNNPNHDIIMMLRNEMVNDPRFGPYLQVYDGYCLYGGQSASGPFYIIGGDMPGPADGRYGGVQRFDLDDHYATLSTSPITHIAVLYWDGSNPIHADFDFTPAPALSMAPVTFTELTWQLYPSVDSWSWDFGDGNTDSGPTKNVVQHTYQAPGIYTVCMTAYDNAGPTATECKDITVLNHPPIADFDFVIDTKAPYRNVQFTDKSYDPDGSVVGWQWIVEGTQMSSSQNPIITMPGFGSMNVTLRVRDDSGDWNETTQQVTINNAPPRVVRPTHNLIEVEIGSLVSFYTEGRDPESHPLMYRLLEGPEGMTMDNETGQVLWKTRDGDMGKHLVVVRTYEEFWSTNKADFALEIKVVPKDLAPPSGDSDGDGYPDGGDPCPTTPGGDHGDDDGDGIANACDPDYAPSEGAPAEEESPAPASTPAQTPTDNEEICPDGCEVEPEVTVTVKEDTPEPEAATVPQPKAEGNIGAWVGVGSALMLILVGAGIVLFLAWRRKKKEE